MSPRPLRVALLTLGDPHTLSGGYLFHLRMAAAASAHHAHVDFVSFPEWPFPLASIKAPRLLRRASLGADAVVLDSIAASYVGGWRLLCGMRTSIFSRPVLAMLHQPPGGIDGGPLRAALQARLDDIAYAAIPTLMVASESLADELIRGGIAPERVRVVPPGRDVSVRADPAGDMRRGRRMAVLCVANWVRRKGILELLDALSLVDPGSVTLHLVGSTQSDPEYAREVERRLQHRQLHGRVLVHGPCSTERVAGMYEAADVFVLPSFREPYGTVYGEAMAAGLPVVGWRSGNLPYLAQHEREGLLADAGDVIGLARAMERLADDPHLRAALGAAARARAARRPTWADVSALFFGCIRNEVDGESAWNNTP